MNEIFDLLNLKHNPLPSLFREIVSTAIYESPSKFISYCWTQYEKKGVGKSDNSSKNRNGQFLELLVQFVLCKNYILPFYKQAKVAFVPNVNFDVLIYTKEIGSIVLSIKTSLRERYKQADLEAIALKQVHRRARTFLLTLSDEYLSINNKIAKMLIEAGADVNVAYEFGGTPLMYAAALGRTEIAKMLIDAGANVNNIDIFGNTAITIATKNEHTEIVKLLKSI